MRIYEQLNIYVECETHKLSNYAQPQMDGKEVKYIFIFIYNRI